MKAVAQRIVAAAILGLVTVPGAGSAPRAPAWPDTFLARLEALALVETLNATLLAAHSATFTLEKWCVDHKLAADTKVRAQLVRNVDKPITEQQRRRLQIDDAEPIKFRHVQLTCGDRILSEADNWYVPSRLTTEMNGLLDTTDTPFGRVVADLTPFRQTFAVQVLWKPLEDGWEQRPLPAQHPRQALAIPPKLFEHQALVYRRDLKPIAEVDELYTRETLPFTPAE